MAFSNSPCLVSLEYMLTLESFKIQSLLIQNLLNPLSGSQSLNKEVYFSYFIGMKFYSVQIILAFYVEMKTKEHFKALEISNASKVNRLKSSPSTRA